MDVPGEARSGLRWRSSRDLWSEVHHRPPSVPTPTPPMDSSLTSQQPGWVTQTSGACCYRSRNPSVMWEQNWITWKSKCTSALFEAPQAEHLHLSVCSIQDIVWFLSSKKTLACYICRPVQSVCSVAWSEGADTHRSQVWRWFLICFLFFMPQYCEWTDVDQLRPAGLKSHDEMSPLTQSSSQLGWEVYNVISETDSVNVIFWVPFPVHF